MISNTKMHTENTQHSCRFCEYFLSDRLQKPIDTPWLKNDKYAAIVSVGTIVPGWSLVCPLTHESNMSAQYGNPDFWSFAGDVEVVMNQAYGRISVFEHGALLDGSPTNCGTGHAHLHFVPLQFSLETEVRSYDSEKMWTPCFASEIAVKAAGREYLFVADEFAKDSTKGLLCLLTEGTSQFCRKVIASRLGLADFYDYRAHPMSEIALSSVQTLTQITNAVLKIPYLQEN